MDQEVVSRQAIVTVLGGGWSASNVDLEKLPGVVIGINDSAIYAKCDVVVSMDRLWTEGRWWKLCEMKLITHLRIAALKNIPRPLPEFVYPFVNDHRAEYFTESIDDGLNGTNSGFCGFNLAYHFLRATPARQRVILLVGFDMRDGPNGERHWYPNYDWGPGKVKTEWAKQFVHANECCRSFGIHVFTVGDWSLIETFPRLSYDDIQAVPCAK